MGRGKRIEVTDFPRHATARGVDRRRTFVDDDDYQRYLRLLAITVAHYGWELLAFCLMPNHVHLLARTPRANLGKGIQFLHGTYAREFNKRHGRTGDLFEDRYHAPLPIADECGLVRVVGYIAANPVRAVLVEDPAAWPWSSHSLVSQRRVPKWLAHDLLTSELLAITGLDAYEDLIETYVGSRY